jgi:hypothetical protein
MNDLDACDPVPKPDEDRLRVAGNDAGAAYDRQTIFEHGMHSPRECEMDSFDSCGPADG